MNMFHFGSFAHCYVPFCSLNQGSGFGELALQDDAPRAATIITCVGVPQDERGGGGECLVLRLEVKEGAELKYS